MVSRFWPFHHTTESGAKLVPVICSVTVAEGACLASGTRLLRLGAVRAVLQSQGTVCGSENGDVFPRVSVAVAVRFA